MGERLTGVFALSDARELAVQRYKAFQEVKRLKVEIETLKSAVGKEKQLSRRVTMNLEIQALEPERMNRHCLSG